MRTSIANWKGKGIAALALTAVVALSSPPASLAADPADTMSSDPVAAEQQKRIDFLTQQLEVMKHQQEQLVTQVKALRQEIAVKPPPAPATAGAAAAPPGTIGEHVASVEQTIQTNLGVSIHGMVDASYEHNFNQPIHNTNVYRAWDNDGFQLTQGNLHIEKDGTVGFVTELNVGQVANAISSATHYSNSAAVGSQWFDPTQYYLTYTAPIGSGISLQAGRFVTLLGAEVIPTYQNQNFNESRGLLFNLGEPLTHTGIRGSYTFNDYASLTAGLNNGWDDPGDFNNGGPNYEAELNLNNKEKSLTLAVNFIYGPNLLGKSDSNLGAIDPIVTWKPVFLPNTTLETEYLYASESGPVVNGHSGSWQGLAQYLVYDLNAWEFATRGEFFDDQDGARTGVHQTLWELTQTVTFKVPGVTGFLLRGEYRHDNSDEHVFTNNNFVNPLLGQQLWQGQDTVSASAIYAF